MIEKATFGAGCFWGVEEAFQQTPGVLKTRVGYTGGTMPDPSYEDVCSKETGHVEAVEVEYDNDVISFENLLERFWSIHSAKIDPRWKEIIGRQYQSVIFYHSEEQKKVAEEKKLLKNVSTAIEEIKKFYSAEERHQNYMLKRKKSRDGTIAL